MRNIILSVLLAVLFIAPAMAEVDVKDNGTKVTTAIAVDFYGPAVSKAGSTAVVDMTDITGDTTITGGLVIDGTVYTATIEADGAIYAARATVDPCATLGAGYIFFNDSTGVPCYCDNSGVDRAIYSATTACF